jgi:hypothetical protein
MLAGSTGLEPAASGVTGRRSNQLNYDPVEAGTQGALPAEISGLYGSGVTRCGCPRLRVNCERSLVGGTGLEPVTAGV